MIRSYANYRVLALFVLFVMFMALSYPLAAQDSAPPEPRVLAQATSEPIEVTFGPGPFNLMSTRVGLSDLSSYRAVLTMSFDGTNAGQPKPWSRTYTMLVTKTPPARQLTIEKSEDGGDHAYMAEVNDTFYEQRGEEACIASAIKTEGAFAEKWEPAGLLDSVIGADEAGTETVNDVAANHYTFDERAQGAAGIAQSTGEMWIAVDGGYLVRYTLVTTGDADYYGEGIEGTLTWDYELTDVNQPPAVEIPADCPSGTLNIPLMPDASDVSNMPGFTSYTTSAALEDVLAFYQEQAQAAGGQATNQPAMSETTALFGFTMADQPLLVIISSEAGTTQVQIVGIDDPAQLAIADEVPDARGAVAEATPSSDCAAGAGAVPMLPDAAEVQTMPGLLAYMTSTSVTDTAQFYKDQISALGGQVSSPVPANDAMAMLEVHQGDQVLMVTIMALGGTSSVTITSASTNPLVPSSDCTTPQPVTPQSGTAPRDSPAICSVSTATNANQRSGPGTNFELAGTLAAGASANVDGQAMGVDGFVWWRLGEGVWVRSDVVNTTGDCESVTVVQP